MEIQVRRKVVVKVFCRCVLLVSCSLTAFTVRSALHTGCAVKAPIHDKYALTLHLDSALVPQHHGPSVPHNCIPMSLPWTNTALWSSCLFHHTTFPSILSSSSLELWFSMTNSSSNRSSPVHSSSTSPCLHECVSAVLNT